MTEGVSEELVNEIVRRVVSVLRDGQAGSAPPSAPATAQAGPAGAPAGGPGDADRQAGRAATAGTARAAAAGAARVWVTAEMLAARADGAGSVSLAMNEYLTPAARDWAASRGVQVLRGTVLPAGEPVTRSVPGRVRPAVLTRTLGLVVNRPDGKVAAALASAGRAGLATVAFDESSCWMVNARAMCEAVNAGQVAGGVLIDRYAAAGMVLVAKIRGIRPVQGVSAAAVEAALRQFDANVLVIGHVAVSVYELRSMIDRFAAGRRMGRDRTALLEAVEELEGRC